MDKPNGFQVSGRLRDETNTPSGLIGGILPGDPHNEMVGIRSPTHADTHSEGVDMICSVRVQSAEPPYAVNRKQEPALSAFVVTLLGDYCDNIEVDYEC